MAKKGDDFFSNPFPFSCQCAAWTDVEAPIVAKARLMNVRLISMAMTGFFYTFKRPRTSPMMGMLKYDPIVRKKVLFLETKKRSK
ncbi:mitochondrial 54S ribosomal protein YmL39 [Drechmeria coniospora]|uniref:Large ribosomal subunit protein bL33m n=1 Tax=Drechmeria coniospora TaxID=98403 RepID=A0A151GCU1_DRECN|nr:mitochondrial 54S ribosomal protein YmL39 [Drechmeria coniospora]KYK54916.1 mitochondrial 54S ribosomal protein YmL39 [Drechmeria coniospora]